MNEPRIFGFSLLRNGVYYDYPFRESLASLAGACEEIHLALGASSDATETELRALACAPKLRITPTVWDESLRQGGIILSQQTNVALETLRDAHRATPGAWGLYLQADEVLNDDDYPALREDFRKAEAGGYDAIRFRYLHFWLAYDQIAVHRRWYPQEIRAVRLDSRAESYGDAQSFRNVARVYESEVPIFHYGHVRQPDAYARKKKDFHRWWHSDDEMRKRHAEDERKERAGEATLRYLGPHPKWMLPKVAAETKADSAAVAKAAAAVAVIAKQDPRPTPEFVRRIAAPAARLFRNEKELKRATLPAPIEVISLDGGWLRRFAAFRGNAVPRAMGSKQARPWSPEFRLLLECSRRGIRVRRLDELS